MTNSRDSSTLRKAAILIRSLDADSAAQLLTKLSPSEARAVRAALRDLGPVDDDDLASVAAAIQNPFPKSKAQTANDSAVELELNHESAAPDGEVGTRISFRESRKNTQLADLERLTSERPSSSVPFQSLIDTDIETLSAFLECEHPQTIAVVFAYLPPDKAARALAVLPEIRQADVIHRLSEMSDADPTTLEVVERSLESWLTQQRSERERRLDRMSIVRSILDATHDSARQTILMRLRQRDQRLAEQIKSQIVERSRDNSQRGLRSDSPRTVLGDARSDSNLREIDSNSIDVSELQEIANCQSPNSKQVVPRHAIEFDDLIRLSDVQLTALLNYVEPQVLHCALTSANEELLDRIHRCLSRKQRKQIRRELLAMRPMSLRDLEAARRIVAECASRIMESGSREQILRAAA